MEHAEPEERRLVERATLSEPPREFASRMGWTTFGASLGACLGVVMSSQSGWSFPSASLLLTVVLVPVLSVGIVWLVWRAMRFLGMWIVNMAWWAWDSDPPAGHGMHACPGCDEVAGTPETRCCGASTVDAPPREMDDQRYCPDCGILDPIYECCGKAWEVGCIDKKQRPYRIPDWRPGIRDVCKYAAHRISRLLRRKGKSQTRAPSRR